MQLTSAWCGRASFDARFEVVLPMGRLNVENQRLREKLEILEYLLTQEEQAPEQQDPAGALVSINYSSHPFVAVLT